MRSRRLRVSAPFDRGTNGGPTRPLFTMNQERAPWRQRRLRDILRKMRHDGCCGLAALDPHAWADPPFDILADGDRAVAEALALARACQRHVQAAPR